MAFRPQLAILLYDSKIIRFQYVNIQISFDLNKKTLHKFYKCFDIVWCRLSDMQSRLLGSKVVKVPISMKLEKRRQKQKFEIVLQFASWKILFLGSIIQLSCLFFILSTTFFHESRLRLDKAKSIFVRVKLPKRIKPRMIDDLTKKSQEVFTLGKGYLIIQRQVD